MWTVGFVDDDDSTFEDYQTRLRRHHVNLILAEGCVTKEDIANWILGNNLKCVLVDYKLTGKYAFLGTDLVVYLNDEMPDLPCVILTNFAEEGVSENLVVRNLIQDRDVLDKPLEDFVQMLKQSIEVFDNRLHLKLSEFEELKKKREDGTAGAIEEERYISIYKHLRAYNEVDDIPVELLKASTGEKLDEILVKLNSFIEKSK